MIKYLSLLLVLATNPNGWELFAQQNQTIDYSEESNWAVLPTDTFDHFISVDTGINTAVDVFFVYPTLLTSKKDDRWNYPIGDEQHRATVMKTIVKYQASAFLNAGNMYMPYYRQAHIRSYHHLEGGGRDALYFAYEDIKAAFQYYLEHYNQGKGIILAGHSQGSTQLTLLIKEFFDGKNLREQLVAAFIPGIGIESNQFQNIPLMNDSAQTGGFVSWNTLKRRYKTRDYKSWYKGRSCINPITWNGDGQIKRELHKGFLYSNGKIYRKSFKTNTVDGAIWITIPRFPFRLRALFLPNYHIGDINLFWEDIRQNAVLRSEEFCKNLDHP